MHRLPPAPVRKRPLVSPRALLLVVGMTTLAGCGPGAPTTVSGTVSWKGKPVTSGGILFAPLAEGGGRKINTTITDGSYQISATEKMTPGPYRVEITWPQKTGKVETNVDPEMNREVTVEQIPKEYNESSTLKVDVKAGENSLPFALPTK